MPGKQVHVFEPQSEQLIRFLSLRKTCAVQAIMLMPISWLCNWFLCRPLPLILMQRQNFCVENPILKENLIRTHWKFIVPLPQENLKKNCGSCHGLTIKADCVW